MELQKQILPPTGVSLIIIENNRVRVCALDQQPDWLLGRLDPTREELQPDIPLTSRIVSREHGRFHNEDGQWYFIDDHNNLNGTFHNGKKIKRLFSGRKRPVILSNGDILRIDRDDLYNSRTDSVLMLFTAVPVHGTWMEFRLAGKETVTIGTDADCDIVQPVLHSSVGCAKITALNGVYYLSDCQESGGLCLNGKPISRSVILRDKDYIRFYGYDYFFLGDRLLYLQT